MRRLLPLSLLLLVGCGGAGHGGGGTAPFFQVARDSTDHQDVTGGFDAAGGPVVVVYDDRTRAARVVTPTGARTVSLAGRNVTVGTGIDDGYALFYTTDASGVGGGLILDTASGAVADGVDPYGTMDARREVVGTGAATAIRDLFTGTETPLPVPDGWFVALLKGDVVLLAKDEGAIPGTPIVDPGPQAKRKVHPRSRAYPPTGDGLIHRYAFRLETAEGLPIADLAVPSGMVYASVVAIDAEGGAVGFAYPAPSLDAPSLVRWDRSGAPTVLATRKTYGDGVSIASDGRVATHDDATGVLLLYGDGGVRQTKLAIGSSDGVQLSDDGRRAFDYTYDSGTARFFQVP